MALSTKITAAILLLGVLAGGMTLAAQQATFKSGIRTVPLYATVIDAQKRLVPNLTKEDFEIFDNDKVQEIQLFINEVQPITVGDDTDSSIGQGKVLERAREHEVMIYAVGLRSDYFNGQRQVRSKPDSGLKQLAEETGGGYFELDKSSDLAPTFTRVAQELHSQYVLGFTPATLDGRLHKLVTKVKKPGMSVRARRSY